MNTQDNYTLEYLTQWYKFIREFVKTSDAEMKLPKIKTAVQYTKQWYKTIAVQIQAGRLHEFVVTLINENTQLTKLKTAVQCPTQWYKFR